MWPRWLRVENEKFLIGGRHLDELTRVELINTVEQACKAIISPAARDRFIAQEAYGFDKLRRQAEKSNAWKQPICGIVGHEWNHWYGNEYVCHRCKKIRVRL